MRTVILAALALCSVVLVVLPHAVIRPFAAQDPAQLQVALAVVRWAPSLSIAVLLAALPLAVAVWRGARPVWPRRVAVAFAMLPLAAAPLLTRFNVYERVFFHSIRTPGFIAASAAHLDARDMVLAVRSGALSRAYPVRAMTFHHIVNDVLGGAPIAVTYCSLCHTGAVWSRVVGGRTLTLHIGGINNQNMLMRDDETGTFWQQSTGLAVAGPLAGSSLRRVHSDELSFALWRDESPRGEVLAPVAADTAEYAPANWEEHMGQRASVVAPVGPFAARDLVFGITAGGADRAYLASSVRSSRVVLDHVGAVPVALLVATDGQSVRAFEAHAAGGDVELFADPQRPSTWIDATGAVWGFDGCTQPAGRCLQPLPVMRSYWFDWRGRHPSTSVWTPPR